MDYSRAISFAFQDPDWFRKVIVGGLINFLAMFTGIFIFAYFFTAGYAVEVIRRTAAGEDSALPEWNDMGKKFVDGFVAVLVFLAYLTLFGIVGGIWIAYTSGMDYANGPMQIALIGIGVLFIVLGTGYFSAAGILHYALTDDLAAAFNLPRLWTFISLELADLSVLLVFGLMLKIILIAASLVILYPFAGFWGQLVLAHLLGQFARRQDSGSGVRVEPAL